MINDKKKPDYKAIYDEDFNDTIGAHGLFSKEYFENKDYIYDKMSDKNIYFLGNDLGMELMYHKYNAHLFKKLEEGNETAIKIFTKILIARPFLKYFSDNIENINIDENIVKDLIIEVYKKLIEYDKIKFKDDVEKTGNKSYIEVIQNEFDKENEFNKKVVNKSTDLFLENKDLIKLKLFLKDSSKEEKNTDVLDCIDLQKKLSELEEKALTILLNFEHFTIEKLKIDDILESNFTFIIDEILKMKYVDEGNFLSNRKLLEHSLRDDEIFKKIEENKIFDFKGGYKNFEVIDNISEEFSTFLKNERTEFYENAKLEFEVSKLSKDMSIFLPEEYSADYLNKIIIKNLESFTKEKQPVYETSYYGMFDTEVYSKTNILIEEPKVIEIFSLNLPKDDLKLLQNELQSLIKIFIEDEKKLIQKLGNKYKEQLSNLENINQELLNKIVIFDNTVKKSSDATNTNTIKNIENEQNNQNNDMVCKSCNTLPCSCITIQ